MRYLLLTLTLAALFSGCGTKKYFDPEETQGLSYSGYTADYIKNTKLDGATYEDGSVVTRDAFYDHVIETENTIFINEADDTLLAANKNELILIDKKSLKKTHIPTTQRIVSANVRGNIVAAVTADNSIMMYDRTTGAVLFKSKQKLSHSVSSDFAQPLFFDDILVYPTLDGKIMIVDAVKKREVREFIISSEKYFNNVIYLDRIGQKIIAATKHNLLMITSKNSYEYEASINAVLATKAGLYVTTVDGRLVELDDRLEVRNEHKFPFSGLISVNLKDDALYVVERSGYLIKVDRGFNTFTVYELGDNVENFLFIGNEKLYYKSRYITLP